MSRCDECGKPTSNPSREYGDRSLCEECAAAFERFCAVVRESYQIRLSEPLVQLTGDAIDSIILANRVVD